jgi:hypothetical protein
MFVGGFVPLFFQLDSFQIARQYHPIKNFNNINKYFLEIVFPWKGELSFLM